MSLLKNFNTAAIRQGFVIDDVSTVKTPKVFIKIHLGTDQNAPSGAVFSERSDQSLHCLHLDRNLLLMW